MNHLRELLDLPAAQLKVPNAMEAADIVAAVDEFKQQGQHAISFWMGDIDDLAQLKIVKEISLLPFDTCWLECQIVEAGLTRLIGALVMRRGETIRMTGFTRREGFWMLRYVCDLSGSLTAGTGLLSPATETARNHYDAVRHVICAFLTALNCSNVGRREHKPVSKLQAARARRGKAPLFSYYTLQVRPSGCDDGSPGIGSHDSPRVHIRRGHPREFKPGRWTWVQPCVVGNPKAGMVHKDYALSPALHQKAAASCQ